MKNHDIEWFQFFITIDLIDVKAWNYSWSKYKYVDNYSENFIELHKHFHNEILCWAHNPTFGIN